VEEVLVRVRLSVLAAALLVVTTAAPVPAEPLGTHFEVTPFGAFTLFDSKLTVNGATLRDATYVGGRLGWFPRTWGGIEVAAGLTPTGEDRIGGGPDVNFISGSGNLVFTPWSRRAGGPFAFAGFGGSQLRNGQSLNQTNLELGGGMRMWFTDNVGLRLEVRDLHWVPNSRAYAPTDIVMIGAGLTMALGAHQRDTDEDGVPDKLDTCPNTPRGAKVNASGCPLDSDGDKVFDGLDKCPDTPKGCTVDANGCPSDADGDGVCDGLDTCPDTPKGATVDANGCPKDSDGDGVLDGIDQCPNTPKGAVVDEHGCPKDADGDGVPDGLDRCPGTPPGTTVDKTGCPPEVSAREEEMLDTGRMRLQGLGFATGAATILPASYAALDAVGTLLRQWPDLKIEVGGHTDSKGNDAANLKLSQARADSVVAYLTQKYPDIKPERLTAKGYGETRPIVPNTSPANMEKNRRVEFVVLNKEALLTDQRRKVVPQSAPTDTTKRVAPQAAPADTTKH
jgi:outer membrane protein OmpA-like peptidoglycan-associated protein